jgi:hypothetical protein
VGGQFSQADIAVYPRLVKAPQNGVLSTHAQRRRFPRVLTHLYLSISSFLHILYTRPQTFLFFFQIARFLICFMSVLTSFSSCPTFCFFFLSLFLVSCSHCCAYVCQVLSLFSALANRRAFAPFKWRDSVIWSSGKFPRFASMELGWWAWLLPWSLVVAVGNYRSGVSFQRKTLGHFKDEVNVSVILNGEVVSFSAR